MPQIEVSGLYKTFKVARRTSGLRQAAKSLFYRKYDTVEALKDVSFTVDTGEIVGYIGPNGAGKSTTIKIMSGILVPDSGRCTIMGCSLEGKNTPCQEYRSGIRSENPAVVGCSCNRLI